MKNHTLKIALWELDPEGYHIILAGRLHRTPIKLLVDTGANHSCFDKQFIDNQQIENNPVGYDAHNIGIGGSDFETSIVEIKQLTIGRVKFPPLIVRLLDLSAINAVCKQQGFPPIHGIIGGDFLYRYRAIINYDTSSLIINK